MWTLFSSEERRTAERGRTAEKEMRKKKQGVMI
jgi:hypothetical protein